MVPRKLAMVANAGVMRTFEMQQKTVQRRAERERKDAESVAVRVQATPIHIEANTGVGGKLYGSVTPQDIADAIKEQRGVEVDRRRIDLHEPIRLVGAYTVPVRLMRDVVAQVTIHVTEPGGQLPPPAPAPAPAAEAAPAEEAPAPAPEEAPAEG